MQRAFPDALGDVEQERFYRAINRVRPSYIRVDADEATYNLHIILRFELEQELFAGTLALADLPEAWNARMEEFLGIPRPERHARRPPGRALVGRRLRLLPHLRARQRHLGADLGEGRVASSPDLTRRSRRASSASCTTGCATNLYPLGRKFTPQETLERVVGGPIDAGPYVRYLKDKLGTLAAT